jgi:hypothetical protein
MNKSNTDWIDGGYVFHGSNELIGLLANETKKRLTIGSAFKKNKTKEEER